MYFNLNKEGKLRKKKSEPKKEEENIFNDNK